MSSKVLKTIFKLNFNPIRSVATSSLAFNKANASSSQLVLTEVNDKTGYALISLNRPPVNSLSTELLKDLSTVMDDLEKNKTRGAIFTSSLPTIFSSGLDITELNNPDPQKLRELWTAVQEGFLKIHGSSFPMAAALNGHAIAGGCFYAMCCEYRAMVPDSKIGINEVLVGVPTPRIVIKVMSNLISRRDAEYSLITGKVYSTEEALAVGLIDEIAKDKDDAIAKCEAFITRFRKIPAMARYKTKEFTRYIDLEYMRNNRAEDLEEFVQSVLNPEVQQSIKSYYESLSRKQ